MASNNGPNNGAHGAYNSNNRNRLPSAWQPAAPTSTLQANAGAPYYPPPPHQQFTPHQAHPAHQAHQAHQPNHYAPYAYQQSRGPYYPQQHQYYQQHPQSQQQPQQQPQAPAYQPPARKTRSLVITDKDGNPIDLTSASKSKPKASARSSSASVSTAASSADPSAGNKLREAALARIAQSDTKKNSSESKEAAAKEEVEEAARKKREEAAEEAARKEREAQKAAEEARKAAEEAMKAAEEARKAAEESKRRAEEEAKSKWPKGKRRVYSKVDLLRFKVLEICICRPPDLPDMTIERGPSNNRGSDRRGGDRGGDKWNRGLNPPRRSNSTNNFPPQQNQGGSEWKRGQAPPTPKKGRNNKYNNEPSNNYKPLVKSENRWRPKNDSSSLIVAEKQVKSILNKMTKEKFQKLSTQMCEIPLKSYEILTMMIGHVYEKAIDEPSFGDLYAELCTLLSAAASTSSFVHYIQSDEERENGSPVVYRWSNDVNQEDSEIVGPFEDDDDAIEAALAEETMEPIERGEMKLELVRLKIVNGTFIKVLKSVEKDDHYVVFFPVEDAEQCGQKMSNFFLTERECKSDASKHNSFKRSLLNKCQDEFNKQNIYEGWKEEKAAYLEKKKSMSEAEQNEKEEELEFRRMKIKKQMLGNIKFIGQLYKAGLLKEKIMRYCIGALLKLDEDQTIRAKNPEYIDTGKDDMDEEDHEACCNLFVTIGKTIDQPPAANFMRVCFAKMTKFSDKKALPSRVRFMYKDLIELRENRWVPRRKQEKAKTLDEIRKDVEREERQQAQQSQQYNNKDRGGGRGGRGGRGYNQRNDSNRQNNYNQRSSSRKVVQTDDDGFAPVKSSKRNIMRNPSSVAVNPRSSTKSRQQVTPPKPMGMSGLRPNSSSPPPTLAPSKPGPAPFTKEKLERRIDNIRAEYMQDPSNIQELLLSMDDLAGTPDAGFKLVQRNADRLMDCRDNERKAINEIIVILFKNNKITKADVGNGMSEIIEFIDSFVIDSPRAYEYLGDTVSAILNAGAVDIAWLVEQAEKTKITPDSDAPERIVKETIASYSSKFGKDTAQKIFNGSADKFTSLLGGDKWNSVSSAVLA